MDRKNINRGSKKLRVWQDAASLYALACKIFANFPFELKKEAGLNPLQCPNCDKPLTPLISHPALRDEK